MPIVVIACCQRDRNAVIHIPHDTRTLMHIGIGVSVPCLAAVIVITAVSTEGHDTMGIVEIPLHLAIHDVGVFKRVADIPLAREVLGMVRALTVHPHRQRETNHIATHTRRLEIIKRP